MQQKDEQASAIHSVQLNAQSDQTYGLPSSGDKFWQTGASINVKQSLTTYTKPST